MPSGVAFLVIDGLLFVLLVAVVVLAMSRIFRGLGQRGGWSRLARHFATDAAPPPRRLDGQSVKVGAVIYKNCTTVGVSDAGLYLRATGIGGLFAGAPLLIPWTAVSARAPAKLYWRSAVRLVLAPPADTDVTFYTDVAVRLELPPPPLS